MAVIGSCALAGYNDQGQLGNGSAGINSYSAEPTAVVDTTVSTWLAISAGLEHTCGLAADSQNGKAYCWGETPPPCSRPPTTVGAAASA